MPIVGPRVVVEASSVAAQSAENAWELGCGCPAVGDRTHRHAAGSGHAAPAEQGQPAGRSADPALMLRTSGAWPWPAFGADPSALLARLDGLAATVTHDPAAHAPGASPPSQWATATTRIPRSPIVRSGMPRTSLPPSATPRSHGLRVAVRSSGHGAVPCRPGLTLLVHTASMTEFTIDPKIGWPG